MLRAKETEAAVYVGYIVIAALSLFRFDGVGLYKGCGIWERLSYPMFHQNIFHALANLFVLRQCVKAVPCRWNAAVFYAIAVSYPFASDAPVVGLSGLVYAYMGFIAPRVRKKLRYNLTILLYMSIGFFFPRMAVGVHAYCYALGILWGYLNVTLWKGRK